MPIAKNPTRPEQAAAAFITKGTATLARTAEGRRLQPVTRTSVMVRVPDDILLRIDGACRRLGLNRTAFFVSSAVARVDELDGR